MADTGFIRSNFILMNQAILRAFGVTQEHLKSDFYYVLFAGDSNSMVRTYLRHEGSQKVKMAPRERFELPRT